ncbi:serine hydrolase domain-containing protein [Flavobacterium cellulosilyticum]|uniref:Class A beta-lactamase-related serine hydrolase n=1 Tax=Flavobacterium cellulosilyticum TaxID=2541731 RepID=A0A4R5CKR1_9FLAO|nr:serine hydrolase domain-containing protein [Flavobacterium cellulosilyticum]TDD98042.1 class A beta-lactamase-related serine hydrolase [Flavobacterium cellulosilyticum]
MNFKKTIQLLNLVLLLLVLSSCKKHDNDISDADLPKDSLPMMHPSEKEPSKLTAAYINKKKAEIESFYNKNWPHNSLNGSFLVAKDGQIIYERYEGYSNLRAKTPITADTPLHLASVSKMVTATAILKLVNANKLKLDQKVNSILKEFPYPDVTVRMLLNHRSGMRSYSYFTDKKEIWDRHKTITNQQLLTLMATKHIALESKTNTRFAYCNTNYAMLALIIEKITGLSYKEAMSKIIFKPLGMTNTFVMDYDKDRKTVVPSYKGNNVEIGMDFLDAIYGDKNIYSTPRDILKLDQARNAPSFLEPSLYKQVFEGYSNEHKGKRNYGLGIRMTLLDNGETLYYHNGWWHGNTSSYVSLRRENVTLICLSNKFSRKPYDIRKLSALFGDYPFELGDE